MHKKIFLLNKDLWFPDPLLVRKDGLLAMGGDLSPKRILLAYSNGIFPWFSKGDPIMWWCAHPRFVLSPKNLHISSSLKKEIKKNKFYISFDTSFNEVITSCAKTRSEKNEETWIVPEMINAYNILHKMGFCHCAETWLNGELVGGLYGVCIGRVFYGESMFYKISDASKIAFVCLVAMLEKWGIEIIDCQMKTENLQRYGADYISLEHFISSIKSLIPKETKALKPLWSMGLISPLDIIKF
jgi:leucyl/phenylalanyl-tRNA--protein transferase